ncbi:MAG: hypothetical protein HQM02_01930 [Magnetococcales bacterium]|nr:hypothetical protein [Magnetococcales bacterium]
MKKSLLDDLIVDVDGATYLLRRRTAELLETMTSVKGNKWVLSDFGGAPPKFLTVEAPVKYAEIVAQRRLLEMGETGEHARICTHWKRARGKTTTDLFCTVVEGELYSAFEDRAHDDSNHHLLFSVHALLFATLREHSRNKTVLVMFEHDRHVDLLLGRSGQVLASSRASVYAYSPEARESLAETVGQEIRSMLADVTGKLELMVHFSWLVGEETEGSSTTGHSSITGSSGFSAFGADTRDASTSTGWAATGESAVTLGKEQTRMMSAEWAHKLAKSLDVPLKSLKPRMHDSRGQEFVASSLPAALQALTVSDSSSPALDRMQYLAQRSVPLVTFFSLLLVAGLYLGALWLQRQSNLMADETMKLTDIVSSAAMKVEPVDPGYQKVVAFTDNLSRLKVAPSLQGILTDVTKSLSGRIQFDQVVVEYDAQAKAVLTLKGRVKSGFPQASQEHEAFISSLTSRNYRVLKSDFSTDVMELQFTLKLERE